MNLFGLTITRRKQNPGPLVTTLPDASRGWFPIIKESFTGAWQRNVEIRADSVLTHGTVFACTTLIAADIAKLWLNLVEQDEDGIRTPVDNPAFSPVLRRPNRYQNRISFFEHWILTKLIHGNTYALKERDARGVVKALYLLDPTRVKVLITEDGAVYYQLGRNDLAGVAEAGVTVPAREMIHDKMNTLAHPLIGCSPITACGMAALQGQKIQQSSAALFANGAQPGGILTAPGVITADQEKRINENWLANYSGPENIGALVILGNGMHYEPLAMKATDAQLIEQLKWTGENICATFHVPAYMVGIGPAPTYNNIEALNQQYYAQCLQIHIESLELCLDEGLELPKPYGVQFDLDALLRMDTATATQAAQNAINAGFLSPNEARAKFDLKPVAGGHTPYLQHQYWPLSQLASRPTVTPTPPVAALPAATEGELADDDEADDEKTIKQSSPYSEASRLVVRDGRDGLPGRDGAPGAPGPPGEDGLGFEQLEEVQTGERTIVRRYTRGDRVREFTFSFPIPIYRGLYVDGQAYTRGDMVTKGGSLWHCNAETTVKPPETAEGATDWTLAVQRGRQGKTGGPR